MKKVVLGALLTLLALGVHAQTKKWTLAECVEYAIQNNITVEQFELDLENARIDKSDALGNFLPTLSGSVTVSERSGLVVDPQTNIITSATILNVSPSLTSNMTVFDGLRNVHRASRAKINEIANQYRLEDLKDDIRLRVANAYLQVLSNKEALKVAQAQYKVTEQDLLRTRELVESGVVPKGDLLEIEATAANQEQQIVNNEALVLISRIGLAQLLLITDYENFDIAEESFDVPFSDILDNSAKVIFDKALTFRNDIKLSEANVQLAEKDLQIARGAALPTLGAFLNYSSFYTENSVTPNILDFQTQLENNDGISYGLSLNVPVFNGFSTRNSIKRNKINVLRTKLQFEQDKLDLENTINQAYVDVTTFRKSYEAAQKTLDARKLAYDYAKERFDVGLMNAFEFGQAQARLDNAYATVIRTKYDYIFRLKILEFYFGVPLSLD
ncbi:TolC family protein [Aureicoccus marinus]|jgi:outer membrane protein|uniref:Transporter n=1 Tax=Aureicoccus marinus TaxID=754435 RepID=A0A2S7T8I4_9FLAO|nr:TolC family protein [Aureicoccus marinus]PQJ15815.1 transporter [Aureicoccus marinus]